FYFDLPMWAVSIGVTDDRGPLAGAVFAPALGEMWAGARGLGATLNDSPIAARDNDSLTDAMVCTGYSYRVSERPEHARRVANMITEVRDIRRFGAAAIDICLVAAGRLDAYFEEHLHSWDLVAAQIIATEAGAIVTDYAGGPVTPDQVLAASPRIHASVVDLLARAGGSHGGTTQPGGR
ncbi:MAG: inositol monophosphatase family protein, partial [Actinomycetota bacterium]